MNATLCSWLIAILLALISAPAAAQYPVKPITVIVPFAAGGPTDVVARLVGDHMSRTLGQTLVVENVGGAGGTIGMTRAAQAQPDGYTIAVGNMGTQSAAPALYPNLKYDPAKSFAQVGIANYTPQAIVAKKATPADNLKDFIRYLQANQTKLNYGHAGVGSISHVAGLLFNAKFGLKPDLVPYRGTGPALQDLVGRADRLHARPVAQCHSADQGRHHQGLRHRRARAVGERTGRADDRRRRRRFHLQRLERHGRPARYAEGNRCKTCRCAQQSTGRSGGAGALCGAWQLGAQSGRPWPGRFAEAGRERSRAHYARSSRLRVSTAE